MKRLARIAPVLVLGLILCAGAHAQGADPGQKSKLVIPPKPLPLTLRGSQKISPPRRLPAPNPVSNTARAPIASTADPGECRATCAHSYYFCLADDDAPSCPENWMNCQVGCESPALTSR